MKQMPSTVAKVDHYITRSFRDVADDDYIAARALYRVGLDQQFLWAALQAVEKYLKATLLYNRQDTRALRHNIAGALDKVRATLGSTFKISKTAETFIRALRWQGINRYFEHQINTDGLVLLELDEAVWELRRYCRPVRADVTAKAPIEGRLEEILSKPSTARENLIWKNLYYGRYKKITFRRRFKIANPSNFIFPEIFSQLDKTIHFSKPVRDYFLRRGGATMTPRRN